MPSFRRDNLMIVLGLAGLWSAHAIAANRLPTASSPGQEVYSATQNADENEDQLRKPKPLFVRPRTGDSRSADESKGASRKGRKSKREKSIARGNSLPSSVKHRPVIVEKTPSTGVASGIPPVGSPSPSGGVLVSPIQNSPTPLPAPSEPPQSASFDPVPSEQTEPILRRLRLVEDIVRKHGRAYDYRAYTVHELETILASLDSGGTGDTSTSGEMPIEPHPDAAPLSPDLGMWVRPLPRSVVGRN